MASSASSLNSSSKDLCNSKDANLCSDEGVAKRNDARGAGNLATVFGIVGIAGLAAGVTLWLTAPSAPKRVAIVPAASDHSVALSLHGRFE